MSAELSRGTLDLLESLERLVAETRGVEPPDSDPLAESTKLRKAAWRLIEATIFCRSYVLKQGRDGEMGIHHEVLNPEHRLAMFLEGSFNLYPEISELFDASRDWDDAFNRWCSRSEGEPQC